MAVSVQQAYSDGSKWCERWAAAGKASKKWNGVVCVTARRIILLIVSALTWTFSGLFWKKHNNLDYLKTTEVSNWTFKDK